MKEKLNLEISENELLRALKTLKNGSSPGIDGIPGEVYKFFWLDIKDLLLNCYIFSLREGVLCTSQRQGLICLLHKGKGLDREILSNWRPISLTNSDYKLIAKVLALRLAYVLDECVSQDQHAFIKGRNISNMIREIDDIIEFGKKEKMNNIILSLDYAKAFDTISTEAIIKALRYFDLGDCFINWVKILLNERESCVRNGGYISNFFRMERGVRQGCPLSPLLFIVTVELLARSIRFDVNIKGIQFKGVPFPIKIKQYADDTTLFLRDIVDFREVLSKIKSFTEFSGLDLNKSKSFAMFVCKPENTSLGKRNGIRFINRIKILGITFSNEDKVTSIAENVDPKIDKLRRLCSLWSKRHLSIIGKITILKSFGLSLFVHIMQSIGICEQKLKEIQTICFRFIWKRDFNDKRAYERVKRKIVCLESENGGLKMFNIIDIQKSFYLNWALKLWKSDESWTNIPKLIYSRVGGLVAFNSNVSSKAFVGLYLSYRSFLLETDFMSLVRRKFFS